MVETKAGRGQSFSAIVGIGVNINQAPDEFPDRACAPGAGSLAMALGRKINRAEFAVALLRELERTREFGLAESLGQPGPKSMVPSSRLSIAEPAKTGRTSQFGNSRFLVMRKHLLQLPVPLRYARPE